MPRTDRTNEIIRRIEAELADEDGPTSFYDFFDGPFPRADPKDYPLTNGAARESNGRFATHGDQQLTEAVTTQEFYELVRRIAFLEKRALAIDVTSAVMAVRTVRRLSDALERQAVTLARVHGWSWRTIGQVLGVDGSALHRRYGKKRGGARERKREVREP